MPQDFASVDAPRVTAIQHLPANCDVNVSGSQRCKADLGEVGFCEYVT